MNLNNSIAKNIVIKYIQEQDRYIEQLNQKGYQISQFINPKQLQFISSISDFNDDDKIQYLLMKEDLLKDRYEDIEYLGKGCFGIVISMKKKSQRFAAKGFIFNKYGQEDKTLLNKVKNEYNLQTHLREGSNLVRCIDLSYQQRSIFILMELCCSNLEQFLNQKDPITQLPIVLNENTLIKISCDIACGLASLHKKNVALQDMKPDNILINYNLISQIGDFGMGQHPLQYSESHLKGYGNWMFCAPELFKENLTGQLQKDQIDKKELAIKMVQGDLFSFGLLIIRIILGEKLFQNQFQIHFPHYSNIHDLFSLVKNSIFNFQYKNQIIFIIEGLCNLDPQKRITASQSHLQLDDLCMKIGFSNIEPPLIKEKYCDTIASEFQGDIELINSHDNDCIMIIRNDQFIKKYNLQIDCQVKLNQVGSSHQILNNIQNLNEQHQSNQQYFPLNNDNNQISLCQSCKQCYLKSKNQLCGCILTFYEIIACPFRYFLCYLERFINWYCLENISQKKRQIYMIIVYFIFLGMNIDIMIFKIQLRIIILIKLLIAINHSILQIGINVKLGVQIFLLISIYGLNLGCSITQYATHNKNDYSTAFSVFTLIDTIQNILVVILFIWILILD